MKTKTTVSIGLGTACVAAVVSLIAYGPMPDKVPIHWNAAGQVDGYSGKAFGAFAIPGGIVLLTLLIVALPWLSPKNFKIEPFQDVFNYLMLVLVALFAFLHAIVLFSAFNPGRDNSKLLIGGMFVFFGLIGNMLGKVKRNFWMGIRCPWTLASDVVWDATHRFAARLVVATSFVGAIAVLAGVPILWPFWIVVGSFLVPVLYAAWLSKRLEGSELEGE